LEVVEVLRKAGVEVIGMVSIFTYGFDAAKQAFEKAGVNYQSLTSYPTLIQLAVEKNMIEPTQQEVLLKWSTDPANWKGI
jgi:orotate phosphoribosyltransferase